MIRSLSGQNDGSRDVLVGKLVADPPHEEHPKEHIADGGHRERLHQPVHEQRDQDARRTAPHVRDAPEVDLEHHRVDHEPDQHRDRQVDLAPPGELETAQGVGEAREGPAEDHTDHHAQRYPDRQVALEDAHALGGHHTGLVVRMNAL
jgi:hypothetical protein